MTVLPSELYNSLRNVLIECREFESYRILYAFISVTELSSYEVYLRQADNPSDLVDFFLAEFLKFKLLDGRPILLIFLVLLEIDIQLKTRFGAD